MLVTTDVSINMGIQVRRYKDTIVTFQLCRDLYHRVSFTFTNPFFASLTLMRGKSLECKGMQQAGQAQAAA